MNDHEVKVTDQQMVEAHQTIELGDADTPPWEEGTAFDSDGNVVKAEYIQTKEDLLEDAELVTQ